MRNALPIAILVAATIWIATTGSPAQETEANAEPQTLKQKAGYMMGFSLGSQLADAPDAIDLDAWRQGFNDAVARRDPRVTDGQEIQAYLQQALEAGVAKAAAANKATGQQFLTDNGARDAVAVLPSGLQHEVLTEGAGPSPAATDTVTVHYTGKLLDGTVFDSSVERGEPATFPLNRVIPGWTEGVQLMKVGGKSILYIPSDLAYGDAGAAPRIPGGSTLIFEIELISIQGE